VILKFLIQPLGANPLGPSDKVVHRCAQLILEPGAVRDRLTEGLYHPTDDGPLARLERAFLLVTANAAIEKKMHAARVRDWSEAVKKGVITADEGAKLKAAHDAVSLVIEVDDFAPEALSPIYRKRPEPKQATPDRAAS
jgi:acyl-CoA dehydrogenase